ncbi:MAG TPA: flagellar hook-basal body complex protein [Steroidobacteraceae bacterium]|nr:flagellar hook-basal body complex protein [Steroidobacteraceae bacterium]
MLEAIYIGQSGMSAYSKGLDVISNNVANLNTAGFKVATPLYSDELYQNDSGAVPGTEGNAASGAGVSVDTQRLSFAAGQTRTTGDPLTAALDGNGFFVLNRDGQMLYTRAGQFEYDANGQLVDTTTKAPVLVRNDSGASTSFNVSDFRVYPPQATTYLKLTGTLAGTGTATFSLPAVSLVDSGGNTEQVTAKFVRSGTDATQWSVEFDDSSGNAIGTGDLRFNADGTPQDGHNTMTVTLSPANLTPFTVTVDFGAASGFTGVTSTATGTTSQVQMLSQDGVQLGSLTGTSFDDHGKVTLTYSNGLTKTPATLMLAQIDEQQQLTPIGSGLFTAQGGTQPEFAPAQTAGIGRVMGGQIEQSNVDLTQQFSDLIIIQRGYQASSQTTSVANEMIQTLLQMGQHQ